MGRRTASCIAVLIVAVALSGCVEFFEPRMAEDEERDAPVQTEDGTESPTSGSDPTTEPSNDPGPTDPDPSPEPEPSDPPTVHTVKIVSGVTCDISSYEPAELKIAPGDQVEWTNEDSCPHTATDEEDAWNTGNIAAGTTSDAIAFDDTGAYRYICRYHPEMGPAEIVVEA